MKNNLTFRRKVCALMVIFICLINTRGYSAGANFYEKIIIAITDIKGINTNSSEAYLISESIKNELIKSDVFIVVEREYMDSIVNENKYQNMGLTLDTRIAEEGSILNVHKFLVGSVIKSGIYHVNLRVIDLETGKTEYAVKEFVADEKELLKTAEKLAKEIMNYYSVVNKGTPGLNHDKGNDNVNMAILAVKNTNLCPLKSQVIIETLKNEFASNGFINLIEKDFLSKILNEQKLQNSGITAVEDILKIGKLLNVQKLIVGSVGKLKGTYYINLRLIDVESGKSEVAVQDELVCEDLLIYQSGRLARKLLVCFYDLL